MPGARGQLPTPIGGRGAAPLYRQVCDQLSAMVLAVPLGGESALPPEPELAAHFGVSRGTLRRATEELAREGLLELVQGRGTFVNQAVKVRLLVWDRLAPAARPDSRFDLDLRHFVPDFAGRGACDAAIRRSAAYRRARTLLLTPDNCLEALRAAALRAGKRLLVPTYALRRGIVELDGSSVDPGRRELAATLDGMERLGRRLDLHALRSGEPIDLAVTGGVAVARNGVHVDGGWGFLAYEWGLLADLGRVTPATPLWASVHDCQVVEADLVTSPDNLGVDRVFTPTRVLTCQPGPRPAGLSDVVTPRELDAAGAYLTELRAGRSSLVS